MISFWKKALFTNLIIFLAIALGLSIFFITPIGRPILKTMMLVTEAAPGFPIRPLGILTRNPKVSEVKIKTQTDKVLADLYQPNDKRKHPAIIFTLGILVTRKSPEVKKFSQALARNGFVVLVPDLPDFVTGLIWTDSINTLIASFEYLEGIQSVEKDKIGFAGFCAGASVSMVAAEDPRIAKKVAFVNAISPFYDSLSMVRSTLTKSQKINGESISWQPADLTTESLIIFFTNVLENKEEKDLILEYLMKNQQIPNERYALLSEKAQKIHDFIAQTNEENFNSLKENLPEDIREALLKVSPSANLNNLQAKLFILNDKSDTFVPRSEGLQIAEKLSQDQLYFVEVDSFEHVNPATGLSRWAAVKQLWLLGTYFYNFISEIG